VKSHPRISGSTPHVSARPTQIHSEDVVNWLHDASLRLFEARLARTAAAARRVERPAA
jgi:hypothetical protein